MGSEVAGLALGTVWTAALAGVAVWWLRQRQATELRRLALEERRLALEERRQASHEDMPEMPLDLMMRCNNETELWAREQMRTVVQQLWAKHRTWDGVRTEMAALDAASVALEMGWSQSPAVS